MTGNQQPTGDEPAAPYRSAAPQQPAGYPVAGYQQGAYPQGAYPQGASPQSYSQAAYSRAGAPRSAYEPAGQEPAGNPTAAGYGGGPTASGPAAPWTPADAQRDTGPVPVIGQLGAAAGGQGSSAPRTLDPARLLGLVVAVLGAMNFLWGFLPEISLSRSDESLSVFAVGPAYVPVLLLIAGLLALAAFLPGSEVSRLAVAAVSVGGAAGAIVSLGTETSVQIAFGSQASKGMGAILLVIVGIIQAVVAIGAYVVGADVPPWLRGAGSAAPGSATAGSPPAGGSPAAAPWAAAPGSPFMRSDQPVVPAAEAGAWSYGKQGGQSGPPGPQVWAGSSGPYGQPGHPGGYAAAAYPSPSRTTPSADEPPTGPQSIVGTETDRNPPRASPAADPQSAPTDGSTEDRSSAAAGRASDSPPGPADPELGPAGPEREHGSTHD